MKSASVLAQATAAANVVCTLACLRLNTRRGGSAVDALAPTVEVLQRGLRLRDQESDRTLAPCLASGRCLALPGPASSS